jgi:hypothetical protein
MAAWRYRSQSLKFSGLKFKNISIDERLNRQAAMDLLGTLGFISCLLGGSPFGSK